MLFKQEHVLLNVYNSGRNKNEFDKGTETGAA